MKFQQKTWDNLQILFRGEDSVTFRKNGISQKYDNSTFCHELSLISMLFQVNENF